MDRSAGVVGRSSGGRALRARGGGPPVYAYAHAPGAPAVSVARLDRDVLANVEPGGAHAHDFLVIAYFERGGGMLRIGDGAWETEAGDVFVIAPGEVVAAGGFAGAEGWTVYFPAEGLGPQAPDALLSWRTHPLLFAFTRGAAGGAQRLSVPPDERPAWSERFAALEAEVRERRDGHREAVVAHLTLLLVGVARLAADVVADLRVRDEPLLAEVFDVIEARFRDPISLRDVAAAVSLTPGHLTTVVRRRTGRTVQEWIAERRMTEARRLLVHTDLTAAEVGRRAGYADPAYFARAFRRFHGVTPLEWRRAGRPG